MLRHMVSRRRIRYKNSDYDLDLTYITDRVIAMGFPADNIIATIYRNPIEEVARFLEHTHGGHYRVYNLCELAYDSSKFNYQVATYPFADHHPPPLQLIQQFLDDLNSWLDAHPANVAAIHCVGGKGRTGTMICCWLLNSKHCTSASEAVQMFADRRTRDGKGVIQPSQLRYIQIYEECSRNNTMKTSESITLKSITTTSVPNFKLTGGCDPWFSVSQQGKRIFFSEPATVIKGKDVVDFRNINVQLVGDIHIEFFHKDFSKKMFSFSFHTNCIKKEVWTLHKRELDGAFKDKNNKHFHSNFKIDVVFSGVNLQRKSGSERPFVSSSIRLRSSTDMFPPRDSILPRVPSIERLPPPPPPPQEDEENEDSITKDSNEPPVGAKVINTTVLPPPPPLSVSIPTSGSQSISPPSTPTSTASTAASTPAPAPCVGCGKEVDVNSFFLDLAGRAFHWECLSCDQCHMKFSSNVQQCLIKKEGSIFCDKCDELRNFFPDCSKCHAKVIEEPYNSYNKLRWHSSCFACSVCNTNMMFHTSYGCAEENGQAILFCAEHLPDTIAPIANRIEELEVDNAPSAKSALHLRKRKSGKHSPRPMTTPPQGSGHTSKTSSPLSSSGEIEEADFFVHPPPLPASKLHTSETPQIVPSVVAADALCNSNTVESPRAVDLPAQPPVLVPELRPSPRSLPTIAEAPQVRAATPPLSLPLMEEKPKVVCNRCAGAISGEAINADGHVYHPGCIRCHKCGMTFDDTTTVFQVEGNRWYCKKDFEATFGAPCGKCGSFIRPGNEYLQACDKYYHVDCFSCSDCGVALQELYFAKNNMPVCVLHKEADPAVMLFESIALLIRTTKNIFELNPDVDRNKLVLLARNLARSGRRYIGEDANIDRARFEGELNAAHSNFVDFCLENLVDNDARSYLMSRKKFVSQPESFVYSAKMIEKVIKFCEADVTL